MRQSSEIYAYMRDLGIKRSYVYGLLHKPTLLTYEFIKVGMSCPVLTDREYQVGERLVRQLSFLPNWEGEKPKTANGLDFWMNIQHDLLEKNKLPLTFNKNDVIIAVWDVSKRMESSDFLTDQELKATAWAEGSLAHQHKSMYGKLPPLNYADPSNTKAYKYPHISKSAFEILFETI